MKPLFGLFVTISILSGCGDLKQLAEDAKTQANKEPQVKIDGVAGDKSNSTGADNNKPVPSCLSNCDVGSWNKLVPEELTIQMPALFAGCTISLNTAFPRDPKIEILSAINCSGLERLYVWSVNNLGAIVEPPRDIGQCALGFRFENLQRSVGLNAALSAWTCRSSSTAYHFVRLESLTGTQISLQQIPSSGSRNTWLTTAYNKNFDMWGIAAAGSFHRVVPKGGVISASTSFYNSITYNVSVRDGVFQLSQGSYPSDQNLCTRISAGGTLLCNGQSVYSTADTYTPVDGSRYVLIGDDYKMLLAQDSATTCSVSGTSQIITRHSEYHRLMRAQLVEGTPYVAALAQNSNKLILDLFQVSPSMVHLTSLPISDEGNWWASTVRMYTLGERIYVSFHGPSGLKILSIAKPEVAQ